MFQNLQTYAQESETGEPHLAAGASGSGRLVAGFAVAIGSRRVGATAPNPGRESVAAGCDREGEGQAGTKTGHRLAKSAANYHGDSPGNVGDAQAWRAPLCRAVEPGSRREPTKPDQRQSQPRMAPP